MQRGQFSLQSHWLGWKRELEDVFSIDLRSLALTRIGIALILIADLVLRFPYIPMFYGDNGVLPTAELGTFWMGGWAQSLHTLFGGPAAFVAFLFAVQIAFAILLLFGYRTRLSTVVTWLLLVSLHNANPMVLLGGDFLLRAVLFVGMFLPWGAFFALDSRRQGKPDEACALSPWSAAFLIQLALMYYFASMFKNSIEWSTTGNALYYIASIDQYATPLSKFVVQYPGLLRFVTFGITYFQHIAVLLLFFPVWNRYFRTITALVLIAMHVTFALSSYLGIFSWTAIAALLAFMPTVVWDDLSAYLGRIRTKYALALFRSVSFAPGLGWRQKLHPAVAVLGVLYIGYIFLWQAADFAPLMKMPGWDAFTVPAKVLRIDQRWNLFAPRPYVDDGWDIIEGKLASGENVDVFRDGAPISYEKPADVYSIYRRSFIRQYTLEFRRPFHAGYREHWGRYLCAAWNSTHEDSERLESLTFVFMLEVTQPPGAPQRPAERQVNLEWQCV